MTYYNSPTTPQGFDVFGPWISEVFRLWSARWQVWVLQGVVIAAFSVFPALLLAVGVGIALGTSRHEFGVGFVAGEMIAIYGSYLLLGIAMAFLGPGMVKTALKQMRGEEIAVSDIFSGARFFWGNLVIGLAISVGVLACGFGLYVTMGLLLLALPAMVDRDLPVSEAISRSWNTTKQNFWLYVLYGFVTMLLANIGSSACGVGFVVTVALLPIGQAVAYERTFHVSATTAPYGANVPPPYVPPPPPPLIDEQ